MKKAYKIILAFICMICVLSGALPFVLSAAGSSSISCNKNLNVGETVSVTVTIKPDSNVDKEIWAVEGNLIYDSSVLNFVECSVVANGGGGKINFVSSGAGDPSQSITFKFTAIKAGVSYTYIEEVSYSGGVSNSSYQVKASGVNINVKAPSASQTPSSSEPDSSESTPSDDSANANLADLRVNGAVLSPAFSAKTTSYKAIVKNNVTSTAITASAAHKGAGVSGTGEVTLEIGDNKRTVTVTAENGAKKNYTINIYRQTEEETANSSDTSSEIALEDPLAVTSGLKNLNIVPDISALYMPDGYTIETEKRGEQDVMRLKEDDGELLLYYLIEDGTAEAKLYSYDDISGFEPLRHVRFNGKMYILQNFEESFAAPKGYYESVVHLSDTDIDAYKSENEALGDFYIIYCYVDGEYGFYRFDSLEEVFQRAPEFKPDTLSKADTEPSGGSSVLNKLLSLKNEAKAVVALVAFGSICIIVLAVLFIVKVSSKKPAKPAVFNPEKEPNPFEETDVYSGFDFVDDK